MTDHTPCSELVQARARIEELERGRDEALSMWRDVRDERDHARDRIGILERDLAESRADRPVALAELRKLTEERDRARSELVRARCRIVELADDPERVRLALAERDSARADLRKVTEERDRLKAAAFERLPDLARLKIGRDAALPPLRGWLLDSDDRSKALELRFDTGAEISPAVAAVLDLAMGGEHRLTLTAERCEP